MHEHSDSEESPPADRAATVVPVVLSGGSGTRLWPLSRELYPKQLLALCSDGTMFQDTVRRVADPARFAAPVIVCNREHRFLIAEQLRALGLAPRAIMLEPCGRNTAPACAAAALAVAQDDPDAQILVLPADHVITDLAAFDRAIATGTAAAAAGCLVTFGITPTAPETGYGYIALGPPLERGDGVCRVASFTEKPSREVAASYCADGDHLWNSGMFLFPVRRLIEAFEAHAPAVLAAAQAALDQGHADLDFFRLGDAAFEAAPSISIDYAVMEHTTAAAVVPCDLGWTDVGTWAALWQVGDKDDAGNVAIGDVVTEAARNCYIRSETHLTAALGVEDLVIVVTDDATLVAHRARAQEVKTVVERLRADGRTELLTHRRVHRPWGSYEGLLVGDRFQVKRLAVHPGGRLSLQRHYHRAEHWVVVKGTALVTSGDTQLLLYENQSHYIPVGTIHRLENPGKVTLEIVEVQSGAYLGEDDIERFEDAYGRKT